MSELPARTSILGRVVWRNSVNNKYTLSQSYRGFCLSCLSVLDLAQTDISIVRKAIPVSNKSRAVTAYSIDNINN